MAFKSVLLAAGAIVITASVVSAQTVGIGTTAKGATSQVSAAIAKVASQHAGMQMRPTPMAGTQKYIPAVNDGSLEFGVANIMQTAWSINGQVLSEGRRPKYSPGSNIDEIQGGTISGEKDQF